MHLRVQEVQNRGWGHCQEETRGKSTPPQQLLSLRNKNSVLGFLGHKFVDLGQRLHFVNTVGICLSLTHGYGSFLYSAAAQVVGT